MAVAQPRNLREAAAVEAGMKAKYPQMYQENWPGNKKRKKKENPSVAEARKLQKSALEEALTGEEIRRLAGR